MVIAKVIHAAGRQFVPVWRFGKAQAAHMVLNITCPCYLTPLGRELYIIPAGVATSGEAGFDLEGSLESTIFPYGKGKPL
jgi:hypothetical protein